MIDGHQELNNTDLQLSVNKQLSKIVKRDQSFRSLITPQIQERINIAQTDANLREKFIKEMSTSDAKNREEMQKLIDENRLFLPEHFRDAALIFDHGETAEDYHKSFELSLKAVDLGMLPVSTILAQAFDRCMVKKQQDAGVPNIEIKQRFGTQSIQENGQWIYFQLDGLATDAELKMFEPLLQGFSVKPKGEQDSISQRISQEWQALNKDEKQQILNKMKGELVEAEIKYSKISSGATGPTETK